MEKSTYRFNQQTLNERILPTTITSEGEKLFFELFEITFKEAKECATWEGEIGEHFRGLFEYIKHYKEEYETKQSMGME